MINILLVMGETIAFMGSFLSHIMTIQRILSFQNSRLESISVTDQLTQLKNRRAVEAYKEGLFSEKPTFSVIMSDIDDFKKINDTYGHKCGDEALKYIANIFITNARKSDTIVRWGGEEILVLLPDTSLDEAKNVIEKIREELCRSPFTWENKAINLTLTFGVTEKNDSRTLEELINLADKYLYAGKEDGKNVVIDKVAYNLINNK